MLVPLSSKHMYTRVDVEKMVSTDLVSSKVNVVSECVHSI